MSHLKKDRDSNPNPYSKDTISWYSPLTPLASKICSLPLTPQHLQMQPQSSNKFVQNEEQDMKMKMKMVLPMPIFMAPSAETQTRKATINLDKAIAYELKHGRKLDPKMDTKKLRRTVSNRLSAQRSRVRKAQHIHDMESKVTELENTITMVRLRVESVRENRRLLQQQNEALERLVQIRLQEANVSQMVAEKNKAELGRLKGQMKDLQTWQLYRQPQPQPQLSFLNFQP